MAEAKRDGNFVTTLLAVSSVDGVTPVTLYANPTTHRLLVDLAGGGSGTVQTISIASANGFAGTSDANPSAPTLTISTTITGILKGNGTAISAAGAGDVDSILPTQTGNNGKYLTTNGTVSSWATIAAGGDVTKVGTPVNNQVGVWTGDGTLEGDTALTFDTTTDTLTVAGEVVTPEIQAASSAGLAFRSNSGSLVADFGAGGGQNATFEDGTTVKGLFTVGSGAANGTIQSNGNYDLILQTGNITTGSITISDGANANINISPNGSGVINLVSNQVLVNGGAADVSIFSDATASQLISSTTAGSYFDISSTDTDAYLELNSYSTGVTGPYVKLTHSSASPAANDVNGYITFDGRDSGAGLVEYTQLKSVIVDPTNASEDGKFVFAVTTAGTKADELELTGAALYPTTNAGLDLGTSSLNFGSVFLNSNINFGGTTNYIQRSANALRFGGWASGITSDTSISPQTNDGAALGTTALGWSDIYLATGANVLVNNANAKRTLIATAAGGTPTTTSGCAAATKVEAGTNDVDYYVLDFDASTIEYAFWNLVMPDNYDGGTITAEFYWTAAAGAAGNVVWALQGRSYANDEAIDQAWGTAQEVTDAWIANGDVHVSSATSAITLGGTPAGGEYVALRAYRNATSGSDTMTGDARLLSIKIKYGINAYSD